MLKLQGNNSAQPTGLPGSAGLGAAVRDRSFSEGDSMTSTEILKSPEKSQHMDTSTPNLAKKRPRTEEVDEGMKQFFLQALKIKRKRSFNHSRQTWEKWPGKLRQMPRPLRGTRMR